jgi:DNA-binding NarL/FixJ family response regulator
MTRILIVDDHPLFREALHSAIEAAYPDGHAEDAVNVEDAIAVLGSDRSYDLILLDLNIPGVSGFEGLIRLRGLFPRLPVVVVSGHEEPRIVAEVMACGASGFIPKSVRKAELTKAIRQVLDGSVYLPPDYAAPAPAPEESDRRRMLARLSSLTPQQMRVLHMLRAGRLNKQIAHEMQVGETTVKAHVSEILRKLNVYSRTQVVIEVSKLDAAELLKLDEGFGA